MNDHFTKCSRVDPPDSAALERELLTLWGHINAATYRFLTLLAEFDRNECWNGAGIMSCAHWLNVFCGIGTVAAREKVRVARALESLPLISESFRRGEISYSKVRAMTRIATPAIEADLINLARHGTASQMARLVRHFRRVERREEAEQAEAQQQRRYLRAHHEEDGMLVLEARLPAEIGAIVLKAIDAAMELEYHAQHAASSDAAEVATNASPEAQGSSGHSNASARDASAEAPETGCEAPSDIEAHDRAAQRTEDSRPLEEQPLDPWSARRADGLTRLAQMFLAREAQDLPDSEPYQVVVHIDQSLLSGTYDPDDPLQRCELENGPRLALETARRLSCDSSLIGLLETADGEPLDVGRRTRAIRPRLKRALRARDQGCRFPGCERTRFTQSHHIEHWADGGHTKLDNLVTLCTYHHRLLHEGGFTVAREASGTFRFARPDGRAIACGRSSMLRGFAGARTGGRFRGSATVAKHHAVAATVGAPMRSDLALVARNVALGLEIDSTTACTRWTGEPLDYSQAIESMHWQKHRDRSGSL